jgi:hypothetical protein
MLRDRLSLTQRADVLFAWHKRWKPLRIGYERYGMMADIEHIQDRQDRENYRFPITELGGPMPKNDRIRRLIPWFEQGRVYLPRSLTKSNYEGRETDLVQDFIDDEYLPFPVASHDDMLDALARMFDDEMSISRWPMPTEQFEEEWRDEGGRNSATGY